MIVELHVVDNDAVEKAQVNASHSYRCAQFLTSRFAHLHTQKVLHRRQMRQYEHCYDKACKKPDSTIKYAVEAFQCL